MGCHFNTLTFLLKFMKKIKQSKELVKLFIDIVKNIQVKIANDLLIVDSDDDDSGGGDT